MPATQSRAKKRNAAPPAPRGRVKGETTAPINTLRLIEILGVTKSHRELGVSTTTLHKARKSNVVSKVVEIAATAALANLGQPARATAPQPFSARPQSDGFTDTSKIVFLLSVDRSKEQMVREFARMLGAELMAH